MFQTVQHLFLSRYGVYVIAFNMLNLSIEHVSETTIENSLSYIRFWFRQIAMAALGAPIIMLGTHLDSLPSVELHKRLSNRLELEFSTTEKAWAFVKHNSSEGPDGLCCFFPVANFHDDPNIGRLRHLIEAFAVEDRISPTDTQGYVHNNVPVSWLAVYDRMREIERRGIAYLHVRPGSEGEGEEGDGAAITAYSLAASCGVFESIASEADRKLVLAAMLSMFTRLGILVYIDEAGLDNVVILNPQVSTFSSLCLADLLFASSPRLYLLNHSFSLDLSVAH